MNGWQRIGVVLSVLAAVGAMWLFWVARSGSLHVIADEYATDFFACKMGAAHKACADAALAKYTAEASKIPSTFGLAFFVAYTIAMAWLAAYACIWLFQWVRAGFNLPVIVEKIPDNVVILHDKMSDLR